VEKNPGLRSASSGLRAEPGEREHSVGDELHGQRGEDQSEKPREYCPAGRTKEVIEAIGDEEDQPAGRDADRDDQDENNAPEHVAIGAGEEDRRGDRARPGDERDGKREDGDVADAVALRHLGAFLLPVLPPFEDHLEGDEEEKHPAGDAECGYGDAEDREDAEAGDGEEDERAEGDQRGAERDLRALAVQFVADGVMAFARSANP
jgi:hypothetical protein